jgi:hypothetical protein
MKADYFEVYKDKKNIVKLRTQMVEYALEHGIKPAAREFNTTVKTVKKWVKRFREDADAVLVSKRKTRKTKE